MSYINQKSVNKAFVKYKPTGATLIKFSHLEKFKICSYRLKIENTWWQESRKILLKFWIHVEFTAYVGYADAITEHMWCCLDTISYLQWLSTWLSRRTPYRMFYQIGSVALIIKLLIINLYLWEWLWNVFCFQDV